MSDFLSQIDPSYYLLSDEGFFALFPYLVLIIGAFVTIICSAFSGNKGYLASYWVSLSSVVCAIASSVYRLFDSHGPVPVFGGGLVFDRLGLFVFLAILILALFTLIISREYLVREKMSLGEYFALLLMSVFGMGLMVVSRDLGVLFINLEIMSLAVYCLVGFRRYDRRSNEAAVKYFLLGGVASAVFLYGTALVYGAVGTLSISSIMSQYSALSGMSGLLALGYVFIFLSLLMKLAVVPVHMWMPDVYEGAPLPVTGFMTSALKAAVFVVFLNLFVAFPLDQLLSASGGSWFGLIGALGVGSIFLGNLVAMTQNNMKRILAFSSIAHTGYLLIGVLAFSYDTSVYAPLLFYVFGYAFANIGAFSILTAISQEGDRAIGLMDLAGLARRAPFVAFSMFVFVISMAGIPPTVGFLSKYMIFSKAVSAGHVLTVSAAILGSVAGLYYYLRMIVFMYMKEAAKSSVVPTSDEFARGLMRWNLGASLASFCAFILTLGAGVLPDRFIRLFVDLLT